MSALPPSSLALADDAGPRTALRRARSAAKRLRNSIAGIRGTKTSIARARSWLPPCATELELQLEVHKLWEVEKRLLAIIERLEDYEPREPSP